MVERVAFYRLRKIKGHYYLIKEAYIPDRRRKITLWSIPVERIERIYVTLKNLGEEELLKLVEAVKDRGRWCGGWDLNPRRPTPSGPQPDPFDLARAPPHPVCRGIPVFWLVDRPGFEPGTSRMPTGRSSRLSYRPTPSRAPCLPPRKRLFKFFHISPLLRVSQMPLS